MYNIDHPPHANSELLLTAAQPVIEFTGTGPELTRQASSHPHQVYHHYTTFTPTSEAYEEVLVPDLGADKVWRLSRGINGLWEASGEVAFESSLRGGGPRHVGVYGKLFIPVLLLECKRSLLQN